MLKMLRLVDDKRRRRPEAWAGKCRLRGWDSERTRKCEAVRRRGGSRGGSTVLTWKRGWSGKQRLMPVGGMRVEGGQWMGLGATKGYRGMVGAIVVRAAKIDR